MKKQIFLLGAAALFTMASCSSTEDGPNNPSTGTGEYQYLAINLIGSTDASTRGDGEEGDETTTPESTDPEFNYTDKEGETGTLARFYFFDEKKEPYNISTAETSGQTATANYLEVTNIQSDGAETPNVEEIKKAVLVFKGEASDKRPKYVVAVLNPITTTSNEEGYLDNTQKTYAELTQTLAGNYNSSKGFMMTNSVYYDGLTSSANLIQAVDISGCLSSDKTVARNNPAKIYIERVVAKATLKLEGEKVLDVPGQTNDKRAFLVSGIDGQNDAIYAVVEGWGITSDMRKSYFMKQLKAFDKYSTITSYAWNDPVRHRSYWAESVANLDVTNDKSWSELSSANSTDIFTPRYCQENTTSKPTNLIVVTQLVDKDGKPKPIYKYFNTEFASKDDILTTIANSFVGTYWVENTSSDADEESKTIGGKSYISVSKDDIEFTTTAPEGVTIKDYQIVATLKAGRTVYTISNNTATEENEAFNKALAKNPAEIYNEGKSYYFTPILHLDGNPGVVRNHEYQVSVTDLVGFGTPVYDPETKDIIPTKVTDDQVYMACQIRCLSWRIVPQTTTLNTKE